MLRNRISKYFAPPMQSRFSASEAPAGVIIVPLAQLPAAFRASLAMQQQLYRLALEQARYFFSRGQAGLVVIYGMVVWTGSNNIDWRFPESVRCGWSDQSPALRHYGLYQHFASLYCAMGSFILPDLLVHWE